MATLKAHTPIAARSPYFINCAPATGTIVSAELVVTVQRGSRLASVTSMTDIKSYTVTKTDAIDGIIVFDISPLIRDFFDTAIKLESPSNNTEEAGVGEIYFVKVVKSIVNSVSSESDVTTYYTCKDAYAEFKDGVNYLPSTGATGNYPFFSPQAKSTYQTIMATDCYRQMGQDSYAVIGLFLGEFDAEHTDWRSRVRVKFGSGEDWKTDETEVTNVVSYPYWEMLSPDDDATRQGSIEEAIQYVGIGNVNFPSGQFDSSENYLRFGHFLYASDIGASDTEDTVFTATTDDASTPFLEESITFNDQFELYMNDDGFSPNTDTKVIIASISTSYDITLPAFDDGINPPWSEVTASCQLVLIDGNIYEYDAPTAAFGNQVKALKAFSDPFDLTFVIKVELPTSIAATIASINDQPILRYEILCEPKYNVIDCVFINKWGCWDSFSFLKKSIDKFNVNSSEYQKSIGYVSSNAYTYDTTKAQKVQYNKNGFKSITVNTGFVDESFNLLLQEMMLSETMYLVIDDVFEPVTLVTDSVEFKKNVNDGLINYTLDFKFAYNQIQAAI